MSERPDDLDRVVDLIGFLHDRQRQEVLDELAENREGVLELAEQIASNPKVEHAPTGVFVAALRKGQHKRKRKAKARGRRASVPPDELVRTHYDAKLRELDRVEPAGWSSRERRLYAVDYALGECGAHGSALLALERELRRELDAELDGTERDFERDTPHRRLMRETHGLGVETGPS